MTLPGLKVNDQSDYEIEGIVEMLANAFAKVHKTAVLGEHQGNLELQMKDLLTNPIMLTKNKNIIRQSRPQREIKCRSR